MHRELWTRDSLQSLLNGLEAAVGNDTDPRSLGRRDGINAVRIALGLDEHNRTIEATGRVVGSVDQRRVSR